MKIFFDTNILISALFSSGGTCAEVFRAVSKSRRFRLVTSDYVLDELSKIIIRKSGFSLDHPVIQEFFAELSDHKSVLSPGASVDAIVRDPKDIPVLAAALESDVDILITGDNDILVLEKVKNMRIMKPRDFFDQFVSR